MNISPVSIALFKSQVLSSLPSSAVDTKSKDSWASAYSLLGATDTSTTAPVSFDPLSVLLQNINSSSTVNSEPSISIKGLSPTGRNMALSDPESAYKMMTVINKDDVLYKAQYSELGQIKSFVSQMEAAGQNLGSMAVSSGSGDIRSQLQDFVAQYNNWIQRVGPDIQQGGLLADTQAAQASRFELEQNVNNRFFGIKEGVHGMSDLGITIDSVTHLAVLDEARLNSMLATNKQGVVDTVQEFGTNFAKSANLLNSEGNFILKQLDNLNRAVQYIADNRDSLQEEFGTGNAAKPAGQVAQALAAYQQMYGA